MTRHFCIKLNFVIKSLTAARVSLIKEHASKRLSRTHARANNQRIARMQIYFLFKNMNYVRTYTLFKNYYYDLAMSNVIADFAPNFTEFKI